MSGGVKLDQPGGFVAEFRTEIAKLGAELGDCGGTRAKPAIELFERVVVDQIKLDVLVAAAFARLYVGLAEEIQLGTFLFGDGRWRGFFDVRVFGRRNARLSRCRNVWFIWRWILGQTGAPDC